ncbi:MULTISPECIES: hypothetical protein [Bacillus]|uniref:hypothetical protein n=1 Tax=Bacillus TaxID=1386 RepID=UPI00036A7D15|nr:MULTISPECIES: hypothetical protein [Bacillus]
MMVCEWKPFTTDMKTYTREDIEELTGDEFEAMRFDEGAEFPSIIWTTNFVCIVKENARMISDISITKIPRNPVCE